MRVTLGQFGRVVGNCDPVNGVYITCCSINNANMHRHNMDTPTRIAFGFKIFRLQSIDLVTKVYLLDFALYVSWKPGTDRQSSWVPAFYITNQVGSLREADRCVEARDDGSVELFVRAGSDTIGNRCANGCDGVWRHRAGRGFDLAKYEPVGLHGGLIRDLLCIC